MEQAHISSDQWCILRTAPRSTLGLAKSLGEDAFTVWTPTETLVTPKTRRTAASERSAPMLPSFLFAAAGDLPRLAAVRTMVSSPHSAFSIFRYAGRIPLIAGPTLKPLRDLERRAADRHEAQLRRAAVAPTFRTGQRVRVEQTALTGLEGVVERQDGEYALVCFGGRHSFKISAWLLRADESYIAQPVMGVAA